MTLSPEDIVGYRFKQSLRGYAIDEVDELLDRLADQVERMEGERAELQTRLRVAEERAEAAAEQERTLRDTLVTAQQAADRTRDDAERAAEQVLTDARAEADRIVAEARRAAAHEADAARGRVAAAADRHREILRRVGDHRAALGDELERFDALLARATEDVEEAPVATEDVEEAPVATEDVEEAPVATEPEPRSGEDASPEDAPSARPKEGLRIRVHDATSPGSPPVGSAPDDGS